MTSQSKNHLITFDSVGCGYNGRSVVKNVSFSIGKGDFLCIVGENGAGKTTIVKTLTGLIPPVEGSIVPSPELSIGYLPQNKSVTSDFPAKVQEIVASGRVRKGLSGMFFNRTDKKKIAAAMERMGIRDIAGEPFRKLSGGQRQRVLLARALAADSNLLVLDEPAASLDPDAVNTLYALLRGIKSAGDVAIAMVSHDVCCAVECATHILHLAHHIRFYGTVEAYKSSDEGRTFLSAAGITHHHEHEAQND